MNRRPFGTVRTIVQSIPDAVTDRASIQGLDPAAVARGRALARAIAVPPAVPTALRNPEFVAAIHERAARASALSMGPGVLCRAFASQPAPRGVEGMPALERPEVADWMGAGLPRLPRPVAPFGLRRAEHLRRVWARRIAFAAAAAIFVCAGGFVLSWGTSAPPDPVFEVAVTPLSNDHPSDFLRGLVDRQIR